MAEQRCETTDLLPDQCGCRKHRDSEILDVYRGLKVTIYIVAAFPGVCFLCGARIGEGDGLGKVVDPSESTKKAVGWCCEPCVGKIERANRSE